MLVHIALDIIENDLQDFYINILGGTIVRQFVLNDSISSSVFQLPKSVDVTILDIQDVQFELFTNKAENECLPDYKHLCFDMKNAQEIRDKAVAGNYKIHERQGSAGITYFIKDRNNNMFEIKSA